MITLHIIDIHFEPNNTFPHIWILHVALLDPIGSPLGVRWAYSVFTGIYTHEGKRRWRRDGDGVLVKLV